MSEPPTPPYTEATVELVARASFEAEYGPAGREMWATTSSESRDVYLADARCVLNALVKAGLLLPEGAETRTEYGVQLTFPDEDPIAVPAVNRWAAERSARMTGGVATRRLVERTTWSAAWRPAGREVAEEALSLDVSAGGVVGWRAAEGGGEADQSKERT